MRRQHMVLPASLVFLRSFVPQFVEGFDCSISMSLSTIYFARPLNTISVMAMGNET